MLGGKQQSSSNIEVLAMGMIFSVSGTLPNFVNTIIKFISAILTGDKDLHNLSGCLTYKLRRLGPMFRTRI